MFQRITTYILLLTLSVLTVSGQDLSHNHIIHRVMLDSIGTNVAETVIYYDGLGRKEEVIQRRATPCYNGNISAVEWQQLDAMMASTPTQHHYVYSYDSMNRLTAADYGATCLTYERAMDFSWKYPS